PVPGLVPLSRASSESRTSHIAMRLLFSSSHARLVDEMGQRLSDAGVPCEVRYCPSEVGASSSGGYRELWIKVDQELQWATSLVAMHCEIARN
ncbi:MAG: hypothetical protein ACREIC_14920, partial [Limisphaerales bacterium]